MEGFHGVGSSPTIVSYYKALYDLPQVHGLVYSGLAQINVPRHGGRCDMVKGGHGHDVVEYGQPQN